MEFEALAKKALNGDTEAQKDVLWHLVRNDHDLKFICDSLAAFERVTTKDEHAEVVFSLSQAFLEQKNWRVAGKFLQIAADSGVAEAWYNLGYFYLNGLGGFEESPEKQLECLIMSAKLGCREARDTLRREGISW